MTNHVVVASRVSKSIAGKRNALMISCASAAMAAAALAPQAARAQAIIEVGSFKGSITGTSGTVNRSIGAGSTSETITVGQSNTVINWAPYDTQGVGTINFLPAGNSATFTSTEGVSNYTVLNRVVPTDPNRAIGLNGSILSTLEGTSTKGGNIWFYTPGGIVVGSTAVFDVGGLLLSTADMPGFSADANGFSFSTFTANPESRVEIASGAQINALQQNSYVALVAPRVDQGGTVRVNGSAAT
jgi:filamentous hemagglutinin family protein